MAVKEVCKQFIRCQANAADPTDALSVSIMGVPSKTRGRVHTLRVGFFFFVIYLHSLCRVGNCGGNSSDLQCITKLGIKAAFEIALKVMAEECCVYVSAEWFIQESGWSPVHRRLHLQLCNPRRMLSSPIYFCISMLYSGQIRGELDRMVWEKEGDRGLESNSGRCRKG